jgi:hypothetical protein
VTRARPRTLRLSPPARAKVDALLEALASDRRARSEAPASRLDVLADECARTLKRDLAFLEPFLRDGHCNGTVPVEVGVDLDTEAMLEEIAHQMGFKSWKYVLLFWLAVRTERYR